jgi:BASS family bile acid:Na+ symporter
MDPRQIVMTAFQVSILCTVFGFGLRAGPSDLVYLFKRPSLLLRSLFSVLVVMPVVAVVLAKMFNIRPAAEIALIALAISPVPPLLPTRQAQAGGQESYGLALMVTLALLAIVAVPVEAEILQRVFHRPLGAAPGAIARVVLTMIALPLIAGLVGRVELPSLAARIETPVALIGKVLMPLAIVALLVGTWRELWSAVGGGALIAMVAFVVSGLVAGDLLGGTAPEHSVVLALSTACRHPAIALSIASANFPDQHFVGTILLYLIVVAVIAIPYLAWQRRHIVAAAPA